MACFALLLLALFVLPVLVSGCLPDMRGGVPWYAARRDPTGLAPDPATTEEAVIQVYAARAVAWRGIFAVHTWIAVKSSGARRYTRYEVLGFGVADGAPAVRIDRMIELLGTYPFVTPAKAGVHGRRQSGCSGSLLSRE